MDEHIRQRSGLCITLICVAGLNGLLWGRLSIAIDCGPGVLALLVGVLTGTVAVLFRRSPLRERMIVGVLSTTLGLCLFAWVARPPVWQAKTAVASDEIDGLCVRATALRICHERKVMGVFDLSDVPEPIREEARQRVGGMSQNDKWTLCDRTFGKRINEGSRGEEDAVWPPGGALWAVLTLAASAVPAAIAQRLGR